MVDSIIIARLSFVNYFNNFSPQNHVLMICPICKAAKVSEDGSSCSGCDSDLSAFKHLKVISKNRNTLKTTSISLGITLLLALIGLGFAYINAESSQSKPAPIQANTEMDKLLAKKDAQIMELNAELDELAATINSAQDDSEKSDNEGDFTLHVVKKGESMWGISKTYHGNGFKHEDIAGHNELDNSHNIRVGDTLIIRHD